MKKQLLIIGGVAIIMATLSFAGAGSAAGTARNNEGACAVARREREEQREALPAIQNELRQEREARTRRGDEICIDATHVNLKSVLGINEALLTDTNRFAIVESRTGRHTLQLDTPFGGFGEAIVYIDGPLYLRRLMRRLIRSRQQNGSAGYKERRLGSIALRRCLPDTATDKEFLSEWQSSCDFVASILGVEAPRVQLTNVKEWRKDLANGRSGLLDFRRFSRVIFDVANDQKIVVRLDEPVYAMRDGKVAVVRSGQIFIDIGFRYSSENSDGRDQLLEAIETALGRTEANDDP